MKRKEWKAIVDWSCYLLAVLERFSLFCCNVVHLLLQAIDTRLTVVAPNLCINTALCDPKMSGVISANKTVILSGRSKNQDAKTVMLRRFITPECHPSCAWSVYCTRVPWSSAECYKLLPVSQFSSLLSSSYCKSQVSAIYLKLQMAPKQQRGRPSGQRDKPCYRTGQPSKLNTRETNQTTLSFARM